ncbi:MAG: JAB domain-containing protein [Lachnospiraceae bacterium]|nr:JAB domain-containing protein [Lachnospiraceae bacterium]
MPKEQYELKQVQVRLRLQEAEPLYSTEPITDSEKAVEIMAKALAEMDREYVCVVNLDTRKHPINFNIVSIGDIDQAQIPIQNIFKSALLSNARSTLALHCHPSGSLEPSSADLEVTKRMVEAGRIIGIPVTDHIIVAGGTGLHTSIRSSNPELFSPLVAENKRVSVKEKIAEKKAMIADKTGKPKEKSRELAK